MTLRERALAVGLIVFLCFPALIFSIGQGLDIPFTDYDEAIREKLHMLGIPFWKLAPVRYHQIRSRYHSGVKYIIPAGTYNVDQDVVIEGRRPGLSEPQEGDALLSAQTATVAIEKGVKIRFAAKAGILCYGTLQANGGSNENERIIFESSAPHQSWVNITIWGRNTRDSRFKYCDFVSGGGRRMLDSIDGEPLLSADGQLRGGALLIYDTTITVGECTFRDCQADFGGAVYMRNAPFNKGGSFSPRGCDFSDVSFESCKAASLNTGQMTGGGAVLIKHCYPQFFHCRFERNQADGLSSCGGAIYVGDRARVKISGDSTFQMNSSGAEGGAIYALSCDPDGDEHSCGVVVTDSKFTDNKAHGSGGAISTSNARISIIRCMFEDNSVAFLFYKRNNKSCARGEP